MISALSLSLASAFALGYATPSPTPAPIANAPPVPSSAQGAAVIHLGLAAPGITTGTPALASRAAQPVVKSLAANFPAVDPNLAPWLSAFFDVQTNLGSGWQRLATAPYPATGGMLTIQYTNFGPQLPGFRAGWGFK